MALQAWNYLSGLVRDRRSTLRSSNTVLDTGSKLELLFCKVIGLLGLICFMALKKKSKRRNQIQDSNNDYEKKIRYDSESSVVSLPVTCQRSNVEAFKQSIQASIRSGPLSTDKPELCLRKSEVVPINQSLMKFVIGILENSF